MKKWMLVAVVAGLLVFGGCAKKGVEVASIDGKPITMTEIEKEIENIPPQYKMMAQSPQGKRQLLDNLVTTKLLLAYAEKEGLMDDAEVKNKINDYKVSKLKEIEGQMFSLKTRKAGIDEVAKREVVIGELLNRESFPGVAVTDKEVKDYYDNYVKRMKSTDPNADIPKLKEIEKDVKTTVMREKFMENLRKNAKIEIDESAFNLAAPGQAVPQGAKKVK